jgi:hypothetical protein
MKIQGCVCDLRYTTHRDFARATYLFLTDAEKNAPRYQAPGAIVLIAFMPFTPEREQAQELLLRLPILPNCREKPSPPPTIILEEFSYLLDSPRFAPEHRVA